VLHIIQMLYAFNKHTPPLQQISYTLLPRTTSINSYTFTVHTAALD